MKKYSRANFFKAMLGVMPVRNPHFHEPYTNPFVNKQTPAFSQSVTSGINPYNGPWGKPQILHLLRRSLFGVTLADYHHFSDMTLAKCLDTLLKASPHAWPPVNTYNDRDYADPDVSFGLTWVNASFGDLPGEANFRRDISLKSWWAGLMLNQDRSLTEKMVLFWHNHFAAQMALIKDARLSYKYVELLRMYAFGNFKNLTKEITTNIGMLQYLNGNTNTVTAPNENYARELQELFTVGKGSNSHYTESDVKAAARVLTGWRDNGITLSPDFDPAKHDTNNKQFSAFYDNTIIAGQTGINGASEINDLVNMIFKKREAARFICRKLYRWFVYYAIDDTIETNVIEPLAGILIQNNFEILPVLRTLLGSQHFFEAYNTGCQIKNPADAVIGACRQFHALFPSSTQPVLQYRAWNQIASTMRDMTLDLGDPPDVAGWPAYYQEPGFYELWINSNTLPLRNQTSDMLCSDTGLPFNGGYIKFDLLGFTAKLPTAADPNKLIAHSTTLLCPNAFDAKETVFLKNILLSGQVEDHYWTDAWNAYLADTEDDVNKSVVLNRLTQYYSYITERAEYQLI